MTDNIYCLVIIIAKDDSNIAAVHFKIKLFDFFYQSKQLTDYIYTDIYTVIHKIGAPLYFCKIILPCGPISIKDIPNCSAENWLGTCDTFAY